MNDILDYMGEISTVIAKLQYRLLTSPAQARVRMAFALTRITEDKRLIGIVDCIILYKIPAP
jgi:hypothetical protein